MKLVVGKRYYTRDGQLARVICVDRKFRTESKQLPLTVVALIDKGTYELINTFTDDGFFFSNDTPSGDDLVREVDHAKN